MEEDCADGNDDEDGDDDAALVGVVVALADSPEMGVGEEIEIGEEVKHKSNYM